MSDHDERRGRDGGSGGEPPSHAPASALPPGKRTLTGDLTRATPETAGQEPASAPTPAPASPAAPPSELATAALDRATAITGQLVPAYRDAVDTLRPELAFELGLTAVENYRSILATRDQLQPEPSISSAGPDVAHLNAVLFPIEQVLAWQLGPQTFHGQPVISGAHAVILGRLASRADQLGAEVLQVVALLRAVGQVVALLPDEAARLYSAPVAPEVAEQVVALVEPWRARPVAFAFLHAALGGAGANVWRTVENLPSQRKLGRTMADVDTDVRIQAGETGALAEVGDFDSERVASMVIPGGIDQAGADEVWAMLPTVAPDAFGAVVVQLAKMGRLDAVLGPEVRRRADVQALHDALPFDGRPSNREARRLLRPILEAPITHRHPLGFKYDAPPGGKSNTRRLDEAIEGSDSALARTALQVVRFGYHGLTGGFAAEHDAAYDRLQDGTLTAGEFQDDKETAGVKALVVGSVSMLAGGALGAYGAGFGGAVGPRTAALTEGLIGGFAGGASGAATADLFDVGAGDKAWSDVSIGDWGTAGIYGAAIGGGLAATSVLSADAARLLPGGPGAGATAAQQYGARFPQHAEVFNRMRLLGAREGLPLRLRIDQLRQLLRDVFPPGGGGPALQLVGGGLADDALVAVSIQATRPLNLPIPPGALNGPAPLAILEARRLDPDEPLDLVDQLDPDASASRLDDAADDLGKLADGPPSAHADEVAPALSEGSSPDPEPPFGRALEQRAVGVYGSTVEFTPTTWRQYKVFQRVDIEWTQVRTAGDKRYIGKTNAQAARAGFPPQLPDGNFATLHHSQQNARGPWFEASTKQHNIRNAKKPPLHPYRGGQHPDFPLGSGKGSLREQFQTIESPEYWQWREANR